MSCRTTPSGSVFTFCARVATGNALSDPVILSIFHELKREYENASPTDRKVYTRSDYNGLLDRQYNRIQRNDNYTPSQKASLTRRLNLAYESAMPDQSTLFALHNVKIRAGKRIERLGLFLTEISEKFNLPVEVVEQSFHDLEKSARSLRDTGTYTKENRALTHSYKLGVYPGTVHAVAILTEQANAIDRAEAELAPKRIVLKDVSEGNQLTSVDSLRIIQYGQDLRNGRFEVLIQEADSTQRLYAYNNVYELINEENVGKYWARELRGNNTHAYLTPVSAEVAGRAPNCPTCGQFADSSHGCPIKIEPKVLRRFHTRNNWTPEWVPVHGSEVQYQVELPTQRELQSEYNRLEAIKIESIFQTIPKAETDEFYQLTGSLTVRKDDEGEPKAYFGGLNCSCGQDAPCEHILTIGELTLRRLLTPIARTRPQYTPEERQAIVENILARISAPEGVVIPSILPAGRRARENAEAMARRAERVSQAQARINEILATDWTRQESFFEEAKRTWDASSDVLYSEDFEAFKEEVEKYKRLRQESSTPVIPYMLENALNGLATRDSGQGFGVELEYEFPDDVDQDDANRAIGRALKRAGLIASSNQREYHSAAYRGYSDVHVDAHGNGTWSWEDDGSVNGGELVTPLMYDEPETWEKLKLAVKILRENGAIATTNAGGHVHVGTGFYNGSVEKYTELARLMTQHEDVIYRLGSDPDRGTHRGTSYTSPHPAVPASGFTSISDTHRGGRAALNYGHVNGRDGDHPEFRVFDSTLDAGAIQAHIKMSVAMVHAASRVVDSGIVTQRPKEALGDHLSREDVTGNRTAGSDEYLKEDSATTRSFLDTIFTRKEDKSHLIALFANTRWSNDPSRRSASGRRYR